ncbi:SH3 domain-containing protein [Aspergillus sp. HF37]|nr:SH3 domain-containing protein [Aspergillus sp. HF37]
MQSMQRQFGKLMKRSADDSQVAVLMNDFYESDKLLGRIVDSTRSWRDAWTATLSYQCRLVTEFHGLYAPIIGSSEPTSDRSARDTPEALVARTAGLRNEYENLQTELMQELDSMENRMIRPAAQAKEFLAPMKKTIKEREDRKLDYERSQSRHDSYAKKQKRSERDNASLAKAEMDLAKATEDYNTADETLKQRLPPLIAATFSLLPRLLATQIEIQHAMLATYYTVLYNYAEQHQFPSPPPELDQVTPDWELAAHPVQEEIESFACLAHAKGRAHSPEEHRNGGGVLGNGLSGFRRRASGHCLPSASEEQQQSASPPQSQPQLNFASKPRLNSIFNNGQLTPPTQGPAPAQDPSPSPSIKTPSTASAAPISFSPAGPNQDYFVRDRQPSSADYSAAAAVKKKPPPPPPRTPSSNALYVTALYDFDGQGAGDLAFSEGDRIRVVEKSGSTDDWWQGELRGVQGSFPANYVE